MVCPHRGSLRGRAGDPWLHHPCPDLLLGPPAGPSQRRRGRIRPGGRAPGRAGGFGHRGQRSFGCGAGARPGPDPSRRAARRVRPPHRHHRPGRHHLRTECPCLSELHRRTGRLWFGWGVRGIPGCCCRRDGPRVRRTRATRHGGPLPPTHRAEPRRHHRAPGWESGLRQRRRRALDRCRIDGGVLRLPHDRLRASRRHRSGGRASGTAAGGRTGLRARRGAGGRPRREPLRGGRHLGADQLGWPPRLSGHHAGHVDADRRRGGQPVQGQPGRPCLRRHHRYRRGRPDRELERGGRGDLRLAGDRGVRALHRRGGHRQSHRQRRRARARPPGPPPQGRLRGQRADLDRPPDRRRRPALRLGGGVHRAHRRPPGRSRPEGRRGALRGGGGLTERGHRARRRVRYGQRPQRGGGAHPRRSAQRRPRGSDLHRHLDRHRRRGPSADGRHVPARPDPGYGRVRGRCGGGVDRRNRPPAVAVGQRPAPVGGGPDRGADGGLLVHRRHRPQGGRGPAALAGLPRLADRARQPVAVQRRTRARADGVHAAGHQPGRALHRPRPLQAGQRLVRPRRAGTRCCWPWPNGSSRRCGAGTW